MTESQTWRKKAEDKFLVFSLAGQEYAVGISLIKEIRAMDRIASLPDSPDHVCGVMDLRGRVIPLIDLRYRFHLVPPGSQAGGIVIVVDLDGLTTGLVVDKVAEVTGLPPSCWEPPSPFVPASVRNLVAGVADISGRIIILLDLPRLLRNEMSSQDPGLSSAGLDNGSAGTEPCDGLAQTVAAVSEGVK